MSGNRPSTNIIPEVSCELWIDTGVPSDSAFSRIAAVPDRLEFTSHTNSRSEHIAVRRLGEVGERARSLSVRCPIQRVSS